MNTLQINQQEKQNLKEEIQTFILGGELSRKLTSTQKELCIRTSLAYNLNPIKREVHFVPYNNDIKIVVGYEVYLKRAESSGKLNGWKVDIEGAGATMKAIVTIHRKDWDTPFVHEVFFQEVRQSTPIWLKMPRFMLKKVAIAQAFRLAFPEEMGGMPYMPEELGIEVQKNNTQHASTNNQINEDNNDTKDESTEALVCSTCTKQITVPVSLFSKRKYGKQLCMKCQLLEPKAKTYIQ